MKYMWTWGGKFFGYILDDILFTEDGIAAGKIRNEMVYNKDGNYIGEIKNDNRLITKESSTNKTGPRCPDKRGRSCNSYCDYNGYLMYAGYEDFPNPETF